MHPDLVLTSAFVSLVVVLALAGLAFAHERRRERGASEQDVAGRSELDVPPAAK